MATSLGSNTYNRQNWEDAVSVPAGGERQEAAKPGLMREGSLRLRRDRGSSREDPVLRPNSAGAGGWSAALLRLGGRGLSQGPRTGRLPIPAPSNLPSWFSFLPPPAGSADSAPSRDPARAGPRVPALPIPPGSLSPPSPAPTSVTEVAGSLELDPHPHFAFSPGLPHSVPDMSWRKPIYPNGE